MTATDETPATPSAAPARSGGFRINPNVVLLVLIPLVLLFAPLLTTDVILIGALSLALSYAMFAASWDVLSGYTGQVNFGHAAFIGVGAYTVAYYTEGLNDGTNGELALLAAVGFSAIVGLIIGIPCLRLKGPYLALATLTAASALVQITFIDKERFGGEDGIVNVIQMADVATLDAVGSGLSKIFVDGFDDKTPFQQSDYIEYYATFVVALVVIGGLMLLAYGKRGLVLRSIQQDEAAAEAAGVPVTRYKLAAFVLSAALAGLAGGMLAMARSSVNIDLLAVDISLLVIIIAAFGGAGTIIGPVIGALIVVSLQFYYLDKISFFQDEDRSELKLGLFALVLLIMLIAQPRGITPPLIARLKQASFSVGGDRSGPAHQARAVGRHDSGEDDDEEGRP